MKTEQVLRITRLPLTVFLALALLWSAGPAAGTAPLDEQLMEAAKGGDLALAKALLDKGVDVNAKDDHGTTALMAASGQGHVEAAQLLIDRDADINARDSAGATALMYAASKGLFEVVKLLVENGAGLDAKQGGGRRRWRWHRKMAIRRP